MIESEQAVDMGQSQAPITEPVQPVNVAPAESPKQAPVERTFSQDQVRAIAAKEARAAAEKARNEAYAQIERERAQATNPQPTQPQSLGGIPQISEAQFQEQVQRAAWNISRQTQAQQIEQNWNSDMEAERQADPEFANLYEALNIEQQPGLVIAMKDMDNKAQVVKDLAKNPSKYANILMLANSGAPKLAEIELQKLSASIKANQQAQQQPKVDSPLSQIRPSNIGGDDGNMSVSDFRNQSWLRG